MSETILNCPFCGHRAAEHENDYCDPVEHSIYCQNTECHAQSLSSVDRDFAIAAWNRRAAHADRDGVIENLKAALMWLLEHPACQASYSKDHEMARRVDRGVTALLKAGVDLPDDWPDPRSLKSTTEDSHSPPSEAEKRGGKKI